MLKLQNASPTDITIVGGGIMGLLSAREFALSGASVSIIDQSQTGHEASWAGGGILLPLYPWRQDSSISDLVMASLKLYPKLVDEIHDNTGIDPEWDPCGLFISQNPDIDLAIDWCTHHQLSYSDIPPASVAELIGHRNNPLWLPGIAQIRNPRLLKSLKQFLLNHKVQFVENSQLLMLDIKHQQVRSITTSTGNIAVEQLILTTGAWTGETWSALFPNSDVSVDIQPIKGQMLLFDAEPGLLQHIVLDQDHYLIPRRDGHIVVGSTVENCGFDKTTTEQARSELYAFALQLLPALQAFPVSHHWSGLRPGTAHGIPYIDTHPEINNLSVCAGHYRNGLTMGPASAKLLADLIGKRPTSISSEPYQISANH